MILILRRNTERLKGVERIRDGDTKDIDLVY